MTLMEPFMGCTLVAYIVTPIAAFALGIDPMFAVDAVGLYGLIPLGIGFLFMLAFLFGSMLWESIYLPLEIWIAVVMIASAATAAGCWNWIHEPNGWLETAALVATSPFIAICAAMAVIFAAAVVLLPFRGIHAAWKFVRTNPSEAA